MKTITEAMIEYFQQNLFELDKLKEEKQISQAQFDKLFNLYVDKIEELKKQIEQDKK